MFLTSAAVAALVFATWAAGRLAARMQFEDPCWERILDGGYRLEIALMDFFFHTRGFLPVTEAAIGIALLLLLWRQLYVRRGPVGCGLLQASP